MNELLIGVTCYLEDTVPCEKKFNASPLFVSYPQYDARLFEAGGIPVNLPILNDEKNLPEEYAQKLDGLLLCGGEDIQPEYYQEQSQGAFRYVPQRDAFEFALLHAFLRKNKPVLGICRGLQIINIYFGGTLIQDIDSYPGTHLIHTRSDASTQGVHQVFLHGPWSEKLGTSCQVNSMHHQAVKKLGSGLDVVGISEDGIIEAIENKNYSYLFAVQWHPEMLQPIQHSIFESFIYATQKRVTST